MFLYYYEENPEAMSGNCQCLSTDEKYHMLHVITIPTLQAFDNFNGGNHSVILNDMSSLS